jgi:hypothetical protein
LSKRLLLAAGPSAFGLATEPALLKIVNLGLRFIEFGTQRFLSLGGLCL